MMIKKEKQKSTKKIPAIKLTERDVWLLLFLHETRFLKREQIERLFFSNAGELTDTTTAKANRRLSKLSAHGFVERIFRPVTIGRAPAVYAIGKNGYKILSKVLGRDRKDLVYKRKASKVESLFLDHCLGIAEFRVQLELALRANPDIELLFWERESTKLNAKVQDPTGKQKCLPVTPDAFFGLKTPQGKSYFFLEVDMGTESLRRFAQKIIAYKEYWKSGKYRDTYGFNHFRVLTVAESDRRLANLIETTKKAGGRNMFLFAAFSYVERATLLGLIWLSQSSSKPSSVLR